MQKLIFLILLFMAAIFGEACSNNNTAGTTKGAAGSSSTDAVAGGGSGSDMYYEYTSHTASSRMSLNSSVKVYIGANGKMRKEMTLSNAATGDKPTSIISIGNAAKPNESIVLDDSAKTWSVSTVEPGDMGNDMIKIVSTASKVGEENIDGFTCVHARIISTKTIGSLSKEVDTVDLWKSEEVPVPAAFKSLEDLASKMTGFMFAKEVPDQLQQMGCKGFLVKMDMSGKDLSSKMELTKVQKMDIPSNLLEIPAGYKQEKN